MKYSILVSLVLLLSVAFAKEQDRSINEAKFVLIGGIEQWITINGNDRSKPIILFIHGGPGSTMSQYSNSMYKGWENDFVLVNWDQRGAGRTYGRNVPEKSNETYWIENPLTVDQMTLDGIELAQYLAQYLDQDKIILLGTSWGSILGTKMALSKPELFTAYVGHAQFVNFSENIDFAYHTVNQLAKNANDTSAVKILKHLGPPPYDSAKNYGQLLRIVKDYERSNSTPAPTTWFELDPEYDNETDSKHRYDGDDYSFVHFVGHGKLGIKSMVRDINFNKTGISIKIPIYLVQGENDILTASDVNKPFFDKIVAPDKAYFLVPNAGHGHNPSIVAKQFEIVQNLVSAK